jgi:multidrug efflux pump subunit AcrA (membrane-fusion protein)
LADRVAADRVAGSVVVGVRVPKSGSRSGWGRAGHRRAVLIGAVVLVVVLGGGVAAWAEVGNGSAGYRMATVTRADIGTTLGVVGTVEPVSDAAASFQVAGQVATVTATPGQVVAAGQTLGTLDTTALSESVSSAQSTVAAGQAKLVEDEESQTSSSASAAKTQTSTPSPTTTTTTTPTRGSTDGQNATVTADQTALTNDQSTLSTDQNKQAADLAQAQSDCTSANTSTTAGQATCEAALQTVSGDEQQVSKDQTAVSKDETALGQALNAESSGGSTSTTTPGPNPTLGGHAVDAAGGTGNTGSGTTFTDSASASTGSGSGSSGAGGTGSGSTGSGSTGANSDTPAQIASDQAAIDSAEADLTNAEQSLKEATLNSPISGTVVSVDIAAGATVSADSSTDIITIIGTKSYEVEGTLSSSQVPSVKVGQSATVQVDGATGSVEGTVSQVGPVQSSDGEYSYPVVVDLPASNSTLFTGSTANVVIDTGSVSNVLAVPTSAVETTGTRSYVLETDKGELTRKIVKVGMVGDTYTQILSGLSDGQAVVLADYAQAVPSSNTDLTNALGGGGGGGFGGFGGGGFGGGAGTFRQRISGAGGGAGGFTAAG